MAFANASGMLFSAIDRVGRPKVQATAMTHKTVSLVSSLNLSFNNWLLPNQLICKRTAGVGQGAKKPAIQQSARQAEEAWPHRWVIDDPCKPCLDRQQWWLQLRWQRVMLTEVLGVCLWTIAIVAKHWLLAKWLCFDAVAGKQSRSLRACCAVVTCLTRNVCSGDANVDNLCDTWLCKRSSSMKNTTFLASITFLVSNATFQGNAAWFWASEPLVA